MNYEAEDIYGRDERYRDEAEQEADVRDAQYNPRRRMQEKDDWYSLHDEQ